MMRPDRIFDLAARWLREPAPAQRLGSLRVIVGLFAAVYAIARVAHFGDYSKLAPQHFAPVGVVSLLEAPLSPGVCWALAIATAASGIPFVLGFRFRVFGPLFALLLLWVTSYRSSWGMIFHNENLLVLHVLVLAAAPAAADTYSLDRRKAPREGERYGWPIRLMSILTVLTYVVAGVAKLRYTGIDWADSEFLRSYIAYDALRKIELGSFASPVGIWLLEVSWIWQPFAVMSLLVELGAPIALWRRAAMPWVLAAWLFHVGVLALMAILFPYPLFGFAYASFFRTERLGEAVERRLNAKSDGSARRR